MRAVVACALLAIAAPASAGVWRDATSVDSPAREAVLDYGVQMLRGDDEAALATDRSIRHRDIEAHIDIAIAAYTTAAALQPRSGEPYARIGKLIFSFYFDACDLPESSPLCSGPRPDPDEVNQSHRLHVRADQMIAAWDAFEARAPLDPRIDRSFLFERAILHTKMRTPEHLAAAARDYETILERFHTEVGGETYGNLAETYMMLGRLDDAIEMYQRALNAGNMESLYGLAVALDRDERTEAAEQLIVDAGKSVYAAFSLKVADHTWFFVPPDEAYYYSALTEEAFGQVDVALADWKEFIKSGIYPAYQARAKAHVAQLELQRKLHPQILRPQLPFDPLDE